MEIMSFLASMTCSYLQPFKFFFGKLFTILLKFSRTPPNNLHFFLLPRIIPARYLLFKEPSFLYFFQSILHTVVQSIRTYCNFPLRITVFPNFSLDFDIFYFDDEQHIGTSVARFKIENRNSASFIKQPYQVVVHKRFACMLDRLSLSRKR